MIYDLTQGKNKVKPDILIRIIYSPGCNACKNYCYTLDKENIIYELIDINTVDCRSLTQSHMGCLPHTVMTKNENVCNVCYESLESPPSVKSIQNVLDNWRAAEDSEGIEKAINEAQERYDKMFVSVGIQYTRDQLTKDNQNSSNQWDYHPLKMPTYFNLIPQSIGYECLQGSDAVVKNWTYTTGFCGTNSIDYNIGLGNCTYHGTESGIDTITWELH